MSISEALKLNANVERWDSSNKLKPGDDPRDLERARFAVEMPDGFFCDLIFDEGRLTEVFSEMGDISPSDASEFDRNTKLQLGPTFKKLPEKNTSQNDWVWVDGDVRARYTNRRHIGGGRIVELKLIAYPNAIRDWKKGPLMPGSNAWSSEVNLEQYRRDWGDGELIENSLPATLGGLRLRMQPWEVRAQVPGIEIKSTSESNAVAEGRDAAGNKVKLVFVDNLLEGVDLEAELPSQEFQPMREVLIARYGTPQEAAYATTMSMSWNDEKAGFWIHLEMHEGKLLETSHLFDRDLDRRRTTLRDREGQLSGQSQPHYRKRPAVKSFF